MAKDKQPPPEESQDGAPEWMLTFSDCMTLLLTFFVLLLSFSSFDDKEFKKVTTSIADALPSIGFSKKQKEAFLPPEKIKYDSEIEQGSERPTDVQTQAGIIDKAEPDDDFKNKKTFVTASANVFWAEGDVLSRKGRLLMATMAEFLKEIPNTIMICERPAGLAGADNSRGLQRAWGVVDYLCKRHGFDYERFAISSAGTFTAAQSQASDGRILEIVLLERNMGN